jgi:hypothetical protein
MGLFDFMGDLISATVKIAATPIAITKDVVNVGLGNEANATKELISSAGDDIAQSMDDLFDE